MIDLMAALWTQETFLNPRDYDEDTRRHWHEFRQEIFLVLLENGLDTDVAHPSVYVGYSPFVLIDK